MLRQLWIGIREKAMAMHSALKILASTINVSYHELKLLSITPRRCGIILIDKKTPLFKALPIFSVSLSAQKVVLLNFFRES
jgi:hypothetical protein